MVQTRRKRSVKQVVTAPPIEDIPEDVLDGETETGEQATTTTEATNDDSEEVVSQIEFTRRSEIDRKVKRLKERITLPAVPSKTLSFDQMLEYLALLTPDMWKSVLVYVYRQWPKINRRITDEKEKAYIDKIGELFQENTIINRHGGGKYKFIVNNTSVPITLFSAYHDIPWDIHEPKLDFDHLMLDDPSNKTYIEYCINRGYLMKGSDGMPVVGQRQETSGGNNEAFQIMTKELMGMVRQMSQAQLEQARAKTNDPESLGMMKAIELAAAGGQKGMELMAEKFKQDDPSKMLALVMNIMEKFSPKPGDNSTTELMMKMMQMQMDTQKQFMESQIKMLTAQLEAQKPKETDELDTIEKWKRIASLFGKGSSGVVEESLTDKIISAIPTVLGTISNFLAMRGGANGSPAMPPSMGHMPGMVVPPGLPQLTGGIDTSTPPLNTEQATTPGTQGTIPGGDNQVINPMLRHALEQYGGAFVNALANQITGDEFAESVITMIGMPNYTMLANVGPEKILATLKSLPRIWEQCIMLAGNNESIIIKFVTDFCNPNAADEEDSVPQPEAISNDTATVVEMPEMGRVGRGVK